jgi:hypothetical protein
VAPAPASLGLVSCTEHPLEKRRFSRSHPAARHPCAGKGEQYWRGETEMSEKARGNPCPLSRSGGGAEEALTACVMSAGLTL